MSALTRWNPIEEIMTMWPRGIFSRIEPSSELSLAWNPRCDVTEDDSTVVIHAELPGVEAKDIEVSVSDSTLTIRGEKRSEKTEEKQGETYSERFFGSFERRLAIPEVDQTKIEAKVKDGVLEVTMPKVAVPKPEPHKIEVKTG